MPSSLPAYRGGLPAAQVDLALRQALAAYDSARQCALLWFCEVLSRQLYRDLGFPSIEQYATEALGFSRNRTWQFLRLARDLERLPPVKAAVTSGQLAWTKAQQVARVATPRTAQSWVDRASATSRRELAQKIKKTRAAAKVAAKKAVAGQSMMELGGGVATTAAAAAEPPPATRVTVTLTLDSLDAAHLDAMIEAAKKSGAVVATATREEAILAGLAALLEDSARAPEVEHAHSPKRRPLLQADGHAPTGPDLRRRNSSSPYKVVLYRCEGCGRSEVVTTGGRRPVAAASAAAAVENSVVHAGGRNRRAIAPGLRDRVLARDGHRCRAPGCSRTRFLEIHHVIPRERGGANTPGNLVTLCSRCHRFVHEEPHVAPRLLAGETGP